MTKTTWAIIIAAVVLIVAAFFIGKSTVKSTDNTAETATEIVKETVAETATEIVKETAAEPVTETAKETAAEAEAETTEEISEYMSHEAYREMYQLFDYGDKTTYVIGHLSPDTDTVTSAIAMADFLNELGIKAEARVTEELDGEAAYVLETLNIRTPEILEDATDEQLWMVDHSEYTQAVDGADDARIVGITDHHGIGSACNAEQIVVRSGRYGSTSAEVYSLYKECGIPVSKEMAGVMLAGLISDTNNFKSEDNTFNRQAYDELLLISEIEDVDALAAGMVKAKLDYSGMTESEILHNDIKDYEEMGVNYSIANIKVATTEDIEPMFERMKKVAEEEAKTSDSEYIFYCVFDNDYEKEYIGCTGKNPESAQKLLEDVFRDMGEIKEDCAILMPSVSRKSVIVPAINEAIDDLAVLDSAA